ncbi:hypothetical protein ElyMa_000685200 [Elysia marginata]|uniref:Uncharacterized protein n=1 Tax=Elysia marginata TaxID=1093978 RepID=A0AAV4GI75_9GAST|nr:hypothetical protein ElyMa_000685200 [Elysia marginata]
MALRKGWIGEKSLVAMLKAQSHSTKFIYRNEDGSGTIEGAEMNKIFKKGEDVYACLALDTSTKEFVFVYNFVPMMTIPAFPRYENIAMLRVGHAVTIHEIHVMYY